MGGWVIRNWGVLCIGVWMLTVLLFVCRLRVGRVAKVGVALLLAPLFLKSHILRALGLDLLSPAIPAVVEWVWSALFAGSMILALLSVLCFFRFPWKGVILPAVAGAVAAWGVWNGVRVPAVQTHTFAFPDLPAALEGYRIVQVSDLHVSSAARRGRTQAIVEQVNRLHPDVICITGDFVDGTVAQRGEDLEPLRELRAREGVFAVTGNHEYFYDVNGWLAFHAGLGIRFLRNACVFPHPGLALGGVPDPEGAWRGQDVAPDVGAAFAAATNGAFRVLLQHQPAGAADNIRRHGVGLQLSGHTHGGIAPGIRWAVERHNRGYSRGVYRIGRGLLHLSPGCGQCEWLPVRLFNPAEIALIVLRRGP